MHAVTIVDGRVGWQEHPDPEPGAGELLVRVHAAGLNNADLIQVAGFYPAPPGSPQDIPGLELAGEVVATGPGVQRFAVGDRVMAVVGGGGQAELAVVQERTAMPVPERLTWEEAGGFPEVFTTAHDALFTQCGLGVADRLCVHGAAGGVGIAAVQLGVAAGARVVATVRNGEHRDDVHDLGANAISPDEFPEYGPFDVILELIGAPNIAPDLDALDTHGRIVVIGTGGGASAEVNLLAIMQKRAVLRGSTLRTRSLEDKAHAARAVEHQVLPLIVEGRVRVPMAASFAIEKPQSAYDRFAAGKKFGKVVLVAAP